MRLLTLDVESFYSSEFSLRKITIPEYILGAQWETICMGAKFDDGPVQMIDGPDVQAFFDSVDPKDTITLTYNSLFDNCVFAWRYGFVPARMVDVMGMVRCLRGHLLKGVSLATATEHFHLPAKGHTVAQVKGMRRAEIMGQPALWGAFKAYCAHDVDLTYQIFNKLLPEFPRTEFKVMDLVLRAAVCPQFHVDVPMLTQHYADVIADKEALMRTADADRDSLMSNDKFAEQLEALGVEISTKPSPANPEIEIPAFAKTDQFMSDLLEHEDPQVQALAAARLGVKSTLEEKRTQRLLAIADLPWMDYRGEHRLMPIPLRYSGAHTHRLSGDWKINMQNLPRSSKLRDALIARPGYSVVVGDLAQIEARLTSWLAKAPLLGDFRAGRDPYAVMAGYIFDRTINPAVDKFERFVGKSAVLGLGYGMGKDKFYHTVLRTARAQKYDMTELKREWTPDLAEKAVRAYRSTNRSVVALWYKLDKTISGPWFGIGVDGQLGPLTIGPGFVRAPAGLKMLEMRYVVSDTVSEDSVWHYSYAKRPHTIWGGTMLENCVQFLARIIIMNAAVRISNRGYNFALQAHDELVYIVRNEDAAAFQVVLMEELTRPPSWGMDLPLGASVSHGQSYGEAK